MNFTQKQMAAIRDRFDGDERTLLKILCGDAVGTRPRKRFMVAAEIAGVKLPRGFSTADDSRKGGAE